MIGADDLADLYDPDEFGARVQILEQGLPARWANGMEGDPVKSGRMYRSGIDPNASTLRVKLDQVKFQMARADAPASWKTAKVVLHQVEYSITALEPLGRLRVLLTLIPFGDRAAAPGERGKWQASG